MNWTTNTERTKNKELSLLISYVKALFIEIMSSVWIVLIFE